MARCRCVDPPCSNDRSRILAAPARCQHFFYHLPLATQFFLKADAAAKFADEDAGFASSTVVQAGVKAKQLARKFYVTAFEVMTDTVAADSGVLGGAPLDPREREKLQKETAKARVAAEKAAAKEAEAKEKEAKDALARAAKEEARLARTAKDEATARARPERSAGPTAKRAAQELDPSPPPLPPPPPPPPPPLDANDLSALFKAALEAPPPAGKQ